MSPLGKHQLFFVEKKLAFFSYINHVGPDEKLQGILAVITSGEHPLKYGLRFQLQFFNVHGIFCPDGVLLPERLDYFGDSAHYQPVGNKDDRQDEQQDYQYNEQYALHIHNQITSIALLLFLLPAPVAQQRNQESNTPGEEDDAAGETEQVVAREALRDEEDGADKEQQPARKVKTFFRFIDGSDLPSRKHGAYGFIIA
jgi:hypothetical protein